MKFTGCKLLGLHFETANPFGFSIHIMTCQLNHASFYQVVLKNTTIVNTKLQHVDFTETDLTGTCFDNCDLQHAVFENTILEKADFRKAISYNIHPERNRVKGAKFSLEGVVGLLSNYQIEVE